MTKERFTERFLFNPDSSCGSLQSVGFLTPLITLQEEDEPCQGLSKARLQAPWSAPTGLGGAEVNYFIHFGIK